MLAFTALAFAGAVAAATRDDARRLVVTVHGDNVFGAGVVFALRPPFVYVVTANHVVRQGTRDYGGLKVGFESWPGESLPATLLETSNQDLDVAVLRVDFNGRNIPESRLPAPATMIYAGARQLARGARVYPIGHPQGQPWYIPGRPAAVYKVGGVEIGIEFACGDGHSGGALFDPRWRLLGMLLRTDDFICTAVSFETVAGELATWRYPIDLRAVEGAGSPEATRVAVVVVDASGRADSSAGVDLAARLVEAGYAAELLDVGATELASLRRGKLPKPVLPSGVGYVLLAEIGEPIRVDNPDLPDAKSIRLDLEVRILTAAGRPYAAFGAGQSGIGFSERRAAAAARDRAFVDLVRQAGERLP